MTHIEGLSHVVLSDILALTNDGEVDLHLFAWLGLKTDHGFNGLLLQRKQISSQLTVDVGVAPLADLPKRNAGGYPVRPCGLDTFVDIRLERVKLVLTRRW